MLTLKDLKMLTAEEWNRRRDENDEEVASLIGANLVGLNLRGFDLHGADLQRANLRGANLRVNLYGANLWKADLRETDLQGAFLQKANLRGAKLQEANLVWADLQWANLEGADVRWADLRRSDLHEANLNNVQGLVNVREVLDSLPRNEKGEYVLCKAFVEAENGELVTPYRGKRVNVIENTVIEVDYVDTCLTVQCAYGLHVAIKEWCKEHLPECVPFEVYVRDLVVPVIPPVGKFRTWQYRIGPRLADRCADL